MEKPPSIVSLKKLLQGCKGFGKSVKTFVKNSLSFFAEFFVFTFGYFQKKIFVVSRFFEKQKNIMVRFFMMKRGRYNRPFLHLAAMSVLAIGVVAAPFVADTYPIFSTPNSTQLALASSDEEQSIIVDSDVFQTAISQKPRDKVIDYIAQEGDTLSSIAKKFGISTDTIRWANNLTSDNLSVGDTLKIPPVTGIVHKVVKGETVYTIAKKLDTNPQAIVDFPFNEFADPQTFSLVEGQMLIVPDGIKPAEKPTAPRRRYLASGPVAFSGSGVAWPAQGYISQFYSWYHPGVDIAGSVGDPVVAATSGVVSQVYTSGWHGGYGIHLIVEGGGFTTLYAHMSGVNVSVGDPVTAGSSLLGWVGLTGRTTGAHLHFETRTSNGFANPLSVLP